VGLNNDCFKQKAVHGPPSIETSPTLDIKIFHLHSGHSAPFPYYLYYQRFSHTIVEIKPRYYGLNCWQGEFPSFPRYMTPSPHHDYDGVSDYFLLGVRCRPSRARPQLPGRQGRS
jgi:hypothetical protein